MCNSSQGWTHEHNICRLDSRISTTTHRTTYVSTSKHWSIVDAVPYEHGWTIFRANILYNGQFILWQQLSTNGTYASFFGNILSTCFSITCKHDSFNILTIKISNRFCGIWTSFIGDDDATKVYITFCDQNFCAVFSSFCWITLNSIAFHKTTVTNEYLLAVNHAHHTFTG